MINAELVKIIFDTDIGGDCDDAGALALCHALCEMGEAELLAVTCCYSNPYVAGCIDAINKHYGRTVPVGINYEKPLIRDRARTNNEYKGYDEPICEKFSNRYKSCENVPDTLDVLRKTLAEAEDNSITFVVTGALSSMERLILSGPDNFSPLTGKELVAKKIKRTVVMGGRFYETWPMDILHYGGVITGECNIVCDIPAAQTVCAEWCGELVFSSFEIGNWIITLNDFYKNSDYNPAAYAYKIYPHSITGRESWDPTAMLYAIRPDAGYWYTHPYGKISVDDKGITSFETDENCKHTYLMPRMDYKKIVDIIDDITKKSKYY